jgi:hypothetical protein
LKADCATYTDLESKWLVVYNWSLADSLIATQKATCYNSRKHYLARKKDDQKPDQLIMNMCSDASYKAIETVVKSYEAVESLALLRRTVACTQSESNPNNDSLLSKCELE